MGIEIKLIDKLIGFFSRIHQNSERILDDLKFMKYEVQFGEREDDIYVASFMKSGTTWMQMVLYQLTTDGDINFNHIYEVSPWLRNAAGKGTKLPELPSPRIIKTHDPYNKVAKGKKGRFIFMLRDGKDIANSLFHHRRNYLDSKLTVADNFEISFRDPGESNWFYYTQQWLINKNKHQILYVHYEDLKNNFNTEIERIAKFLNIKINEADLPRIHERCSFAFMKLHETKFGEQPLGNEYKIVYNQFIREGKVGEGDKNLSETDRKFFDQEFDKHLSKFRVMEQYKQK